MFVLNSCNGMFVLSTTITDADKARKHGLDEFVMANPCKYDHGDLFQLLQKLTLNFRLNDAYTCLVGSTLYSQPSNGVTGLYLVTT